MVQASVARYAASSGTGAVAAQVLVIPIFRRIWLQHVFSGVASRGPPSPPWQTGKTVGEKARLLLANWREWGANKIDQQWHKVQTSPEGTMNNYLFRMAQFVLRRVDPDESFLKALPSGANALHIRHPTSIPERLVRRRLRLLCKKRAPFHETRMWYWSAAVLPQLPLLVLPLPNVTIYYSVWRIWSHRSAGGGSRALLAALEASSDVQCYELALRLQRLQAQGVEFKQGEWPERMVADIDRLRAAAEAARARGCLDGHREETEDTSRDGAGGHAAGAAGAVAEASIKSSSSNGGSSSSGRGSGGSTGGVDASQLQQKQQEQQQQQSSERPKVLPVPLFVADDFLEEVVKPMERRTSPLTEQQVELIMARWEQDHLLEHFRAAQRRCLPEEAKQGQQGKEG